MKAGASARRVSIPRSKGPVRPERPALTLAPAAWGPRGPAAPNGQMAQDGACKRGVGRGWGRGLGKGVGEGGGGEAAAAENIFTH